MAYTLQQLTLAWTVAHNGIGPNATALADLGNRAAQNAAGAMTDAQAMSFVVNSVDNSTTLAAMAYQFFTGKSPTKDGLAYLTNSPDNDRDLNDPYYASFGLTDRYINFGANLGFIGEGKETFAAKYGAMNMNDFVASIYETIIGSTYASAAGKDPQQEIRDILRRVPAAEINASNTGLVNGLSTAAERDLATKATLAGFVLGEAIRTDIGIYAAAANNFTLAVVTGTATYNTDITTTYAPKPGEGLGSPVTTAPPTETVPGYVAPPPPPPPEPDPVAHAFTLTTGADTFTGESLADTFTATLGTVTTLNANDVLNGAGGDDTLTITSDNPGSFSFVSNKISNIEHVRLTATGGVPHLYLGGIAFTDLTNTGSTQDVYFHNAAATTKLNISNTSSATFFETPNTGLTGSTDTMTLTLSDVTGAAGVTINDGAGSLNQYETLNIVSNGTANAIKLGTDTHQTSLATINISGAAPLTLTFAAGGDHIVTSARTIDSHTATGGVTIGSLTTALGAANHTITLGTGRNTVFFGNGVLNTNDTVTATAGTNDTLVITGATAVTSGDLAHVTGIETFRFMNNAGTQTQDVTQLPGGVTLEVDGVDSVVQFNNLANTGTINALNAFRLTMALAADTGSDALTVNIKPSTTAGANIINLTNVTGLETLNIVSNGATGQTAANVITTDNVTAAHVLTGSADLTITNTLVTANFDASAFTGKLTATARIGGTAFIGGTGADTLNGEMGNDTFRLGAQGVNAQSGADTITTNGGNDTVVFVGNAANGTGAATSLSAAPLIQGTSGGANVTNLTVKFSANDNDFSLKNAAGTAFTGLAKGTAAHGLTAGDTMVEYTLNATSGAFMATANTSIIRLTGSVTGGADIKQMFATAIGSAMIIGLAADGNYVVSLYDTNTSQTLFAVVNVGASAAGNGELTSADFTNGGVALIGHVSEASLMSGITLGTAI